MAETVDKTAANSAALQKALNPGPAFKGGYNYAELTRIANDPDTSYDDRAKALEARSKNPWAAGDVSAAKRLQDMGAGKKIAEQQVPEMSLGRLTEGRSKEIEDLIAERRKSYEAVDPQATAIVDERRKAYEASPEGGLSSEEMQGFRDVAVQNINKTSETARRRLAGIQAQTGVTGATAASQQMNAIQAGNTERTNFERDLFLRQREALQQDRSEKANRLSALESSINSSRADQQNRLSALETSISSARANEEATQKFNLEQAARERFAQLSTSLSFAGLGSTDRGAAAAMQAQEASAKAAQPGSGGFLSKLF